MSIETPEHLAIIAGRGVYPLLLAESAKAQGVKKLTAIAFRKETDREIIPRCDETHWVHIGQLGAMLEALRNSGARHAVMAGQITPTHLFRVRMDGAMLDLLKSLPQKNAHTIFGAVADALTGIGIELLPASCFMEQHMPAEEGTLTRSEPSDAAWQDIHHGREVATATSGLEIGQTVVIKDGTILAIEAFEGTDEAIKRAHRLGGDGLVVVKMAKSGHDMRFDIPVIGERTVRGLARCRAAALAVEAGRSIFLDRAEVLRLADEAGIAIVALAPSTIESTSRENT